MNPLTNRQRDPRDTWALNLAALKSAVKKGDENEVAGQIGSTAAAQNSGQ